MTFSSALVLFAHPDDAEFMCGGTIAAWTREGCEVHYVVITDGSAGNNEPGATREQMRPIREREQRAAAEVLGVKSVTFLGEVDGMLEVTLDTRRKVTREVRRLRPEVIVAPDPSRLWSGNRYINHSDHRAAGMLALSSVMPDAPSRPMFQELEQEGHRAVRGPEPVAQLERARYVRRHHGHDRHQDQVARAARLPGHGRGRAVGAAPRAGDGRARRACTYAEAFKAFRFVDDPVEE